MTPPARSRPLKKNDFSTFFKAVKPALFSENAKPSALIQKINCVSWSPAGQLLTTCTTSNIRVWNPERPQVKSSIELKNAHAKNGVAFGSPGVSGDGVEKVLFCPTIEALLASSGQDGMVRLWDVRMPAGAAAAAGKGTPLADSKVGGDGSYLTWHPSGTTLLSGNKDDVVHSIDIRRMTAFDGTPTYTATPNKVMEKGEDAHYNMAFSNSGREVFATTKSGTVKILDYPSMTLLHTLGSHSGAAYAVQHSPAGSYIAVGSQDSTISLWDTHTWFSTHSLTATSQTTSIRDLSFSFDGTYLVAGSGADGKDGGAGLNIFHVDTGDIVHTVETSKCPSQVAFHPTRYWIAYSGDPGGLKVVGIGGTGL